MLEKHLVLKGHSAPIYAVSSDQNFIYTCSGDKLLTRWNKITGEQDSFVVRLEEPAYAIIVAENRLFIGSSKGTIYAIDIESKALVWEKNLFGNPIFCFSFNSNLNRLYVGDSEGNFSAFTSLGEKLISLPLSAGKIRMIQTVNGQVYIGSSSGEFFIYDEQSFNLIQTVSVEAPISSFCLEENLNSIFIGSRDAHLYQIDLQTNELLSRLPIHLQTIYGIEKFGSILVTCSMDKSIKLWNIDPFSILEKIEFKNAGHSRSVNGIHKIDFDTMVTFSDDKTAIVWKIKPIYN